MRCTVHPSASPVLSLPLLLTLFLLVPASLAAQQPPTSPQAPTFEGEVVVSEVLVDVLVTDEDGSVIVGLGPEDFVVEEDGRPVTVDGVSFYSNRHFLGSELLADTQVPAGEAAPAEQAVPEDRYFVLFYYRPLLTDSRAPELFLRLTEAGQETFEWITRELLPNDHVAVVSFDSRLRIHQDFTRDRNVLGRAIRNACAGRKPRPVWSSLGEESEKAAASPQVLRPLVVDDETTEDADEPYGALEALAAALGGIGGRKNLVLFGIDFPNFGAASSARRDEERYEDAVQALNHHNVAVYSIGLTRRGRQVVLDDLASDTGGDYSFRFKSFIEPLQLIARENNGYYLLSYRSPHPAGSQGYQEITVRTANEEFRVRARGGYLYGGS